MGVFKAGPWQTEVVQQVIKPMPGNGNAKPAHVGKVRKPHPSRLVDLPEDDLSFCTMDGAPGANTTL
ncbi:hypothetical protein VW35_15810 [Devosia soli]|uniref:Uncharacterized protein n=1 Tax=Devosia soli TaxID=361041 RepID=A0A0F5L420_9HYPH|nr:hypothetical protein VW35_15810 [Devosia soli]